MRRLLAMLLALALAMATMGQESCDTGESETADTDTTEATEPTGDGEEEEPATPDPEADVESSCDYLLSFSDDYSTSAHKFVAGATITNTGNIGVVVRLKATWTLLGGEPVTAEKTARIKRGGEREIQISKPATDNQIDAHQSANGKCKAKGTIIDTFGRAK